MLVCKICKKPPDSPYLKVRNLHTYFTCGRCINELALIAEAPLADCAHLFAKAAFIYETLDQGNPRAKCLMDATRSRLDPRVCIRVSDQVNDLRLRRRWIEAKQNREPLPRVHSAVAAHFSTEFRKAFPKGSVTCESTTLKPTPVKGLSCGKEGVRRLLFKRHFWHEMLDASIIAIEEGIHGQP